MINLIRSIDYSILSFFHSLALNYGSILNPIAKTFHYVGKPLTCVPAIVCLLLFIFTKRKRWLVVFVAICCSSAVSILIIKQLVGRIRPFNQEVISEYREWWQAAGAIMEKGKSFPSGHSASSMGFAISLFVTSKRKNIAWLGFVYALLMAASRCYAVVHYPSDVMVGMCIGLIVGYFVVKLFKRYDKAIE